MSLRSGLALLGLVGACSVAFAGCGDDDPTSGTGGTGGKGGKGGTGTGGTGKGGKGGTSGASGAADGGTSGTAGNAGRGGSAGNPTGGTSGDTGGGGVGGEGAEGGAGGAGGAGEGGAGGAGNAGDGGMGGIPDTTADSCTYQCVNDDGCRVGVNTDYKCHPTRKRCERPDLACDSHDDCVAAASGWLFACANDSECIPGYEVCIDAGGRGLCAGVPDSTLGCFLGGTETTLPKFGSSGTAVVCASEAGRCDSRGQCFTGCSDSPTTICSVARGRGTGCNATTGLCECTADTQCTAMGVAQHCNMTTHQCECVSNTDCAGVSGADQCVSGRCGCSSANVCPAGPFMTTTKVCE